MRVFIDKNIQKHSRFYFFSCDICYYWFYPRVVNL